MRDLLANLSHGGESLRLLVGTVAADGAVLIHGVKVRPQVTAQARSGAVAGARVLIVRSGAADAAHFIIGTL